MHHHRPDRRQFLAALAAGGAGAVIGLPAGIASARGGVRPTSAHGPYGPLGAPDAEGLALPEGFTARVVGRAGEVVGASAYSWHAAPDGGATFATDDGGWVYVSNSEVGAGDAGVGAVRFDADGEIVDAYRILDGTARNCAGGATPWGTWLSGEEFDFFGDAARTEALGASAGRIWECDPMQPGQGEPRPALGVFTHEAAAVDPDDERIYLSEDHGEGRFYRFTPDAYPSLEAGLLEVAKVDDDGAVTWLPVPDPSATTAPTRLQVPESTAFDGGEGLWFRDGHVYLTTKGDDHVWDLDVAGQSMSVLYDGSDDQPLHGVDNITGPPGAVRDLYVAEDGDDMQCIILTEEGDVVPFLQASGPLHEGSELTGPAFSPDGSRFYISSQRGGERGIGMTWEVTGPFRDAATPSTTTTAAGDPPSTGEDPVLVDASSDDDPPTALIASAVVSGLAVLGAGALALRNRTARDSQTRAEDDTSTG